MFKKPQISSIFDFKKVWEPCIMKNWWHGFFYVKTLLSIKKMFVWVVSYVHSEIKVFALKTGYELVVYNIDCR